MQNKLKLIVVALLMTLSIQLKAQKKALRPVWSKQQANAWYAQDQWLVGSDFIPSTAINQLEMWQADTFDPQTIDKELGYAQGIGMNVMRVFLHHLAWQEDPKGFKKRVDQYLAIADKHGIKTMFVFFDDCWNKEPKLESSPSLNPASIIQAGCRIPVSQPQKTRLIFLFSKNM